MEGDSCWRHLSLWIRAEASLWSGLFSYLIEFVFLPKSAELSLCSPNNSWLSQCSSSLGESQPTCCPVSLAVHLPLAIFSAVKLPILLQFPFLPLKTPAPHWGVSPVLSCLWFFFLSEPLRTPSTTARVSIPFYIKQDKMKRPLRWQRPHSALYFSRVPDAAQEAITWQMFVDFTDLSSLGSPWSQSRNFITSCLILKKCQWLLRTLRWRSIA